MSQELRLKNQSQQLYVRALSSAWRNNIQLTDPSLWLLRDPEAEEKMLRDADIAHVIGYRRHLIAGRQWNLVPRNDAAPNAELATAVGEELLKSVKHFTQARFQLARAFFSGARFGRIHGTMKTLTLGDGKPRKWWVPIRIEDMDKRMYRIVPRNDGHTIVAHWERWNVAEQEFQVESQLDAVQTIKHIYQDDQATLGYGRALREAVGWWWYAKEHVFQESLQAVERFAQGVLSAKVDGVRDAATGLPNEELISAWTEVLEDLRGRHVLVYDKSDEVEMVPVDGTGWELLSDMRKELKNAIFTLVLGANLTTDANEGGSYALAEVQENSTEALVQFDRETLEETLTDDLMGCCWHKNWANLVELGIAEEMPRFSITQEKKQDPKERADVANVLHGMGVALASDDLYEQTGFRKPDVGEEIIEGATAPPPMPGGLPGASPFFKDDATIPDFGFNGQRGAG